MGVKYSGGLRENQCPLVGRPVQANALTPAEEQGILDGCHLRQPGNQLL